MMRNSMNQLSSLLNGNRADFFKQAFLLTLILFLDPFSTPAFAGAGDLDPTFGDGGKVVTDFQAEWSADIDFRAPSAVQPDGKIVVVENAYAESHLVRLNPDGSVDETFGDNGEADTGIGFRSQIRSIRLQSDGAILVGGQVEVIEGHSQSSDWVVARMNPDGTRDTTFGNGGVVRTDIGASAGDVFGGHSYDELEDIFVYQDGRILAVGSAYDGPGLGGRIAVMAFRPNGNTDVAFGDSGKVFFQPDALGTLAPAYWTWTLPLRLARQADGRLILVSLATSALRNDTLFLLRLNPDGAADRSFGDNGVAKFVKDAFPFPELGDVAVRSDDSIFVLASLHLGGDFNNNPSLLAFGADGAVIGDFGNSGVATVDLAQFADDPPSFGLLALNTDGGMMLGGTRVKYEWSSGSHIIRLYYNDLAALKLNADASIDTAFGTDGLTAVSLYEYHRELYARSLLWLDDGRVVLAGPIEHFPRGPTQFSSNDVAVVRLDPDGLPDSGFGIEGTVFVTTHGPSENTATDVILTQADGKIVVAGHGRAGPTLTDFELIRYNADGSLDAGFGDQGRVATDIRSINEDYLVPDGDWGLSDDSANAVAMQPDGKIVVAGRSVFEPQYDSPTAAFALVRYEPDGSLDMGFGTDGKVVTDFPMDVNRTPSAGAVDVALQDDGKIIAVGYANNRPGGGPYEFEMAVARYNADGSLDSTFGDGGRVRVNRFAGMDEYARSVAVQDDGKIVIGGYYRAHRFWLGDDALELVRLNTDGSFDTNFGDAGVVTTDIGTPPPSETSDEIFDIAIRPDGRIVAGGSVYSPGWDMLLARYEPDGSLDMSFGYNGLVILNFGENLPNVNPNGTDEIYSLELQSDGRVVVAGYTGRYIENPEPSKKHLYRYILSYDFALARFEEHGGLDYTFGYGGKVTTAFATNVNAARSVGIQGDGKIIAVGETVSPFAYGGDVLGQTDVAVARYEGVNTNLDEIESLVFRTQDLVEAGFLNEGRANSLQSKLQAAVQQTDRGNYRAAVNQLESFRNEVSAMAANGVLPGPEAASLLEEAQALIDLLSG